jgi:hypothetical protein
VAKKVRKERQAIKAERRFLASSSNAVRHLGTGRRLPSVNVGA